ncbi:MAG: bifunctional nicotinamidase/pyrazinamidase [Myxococcota bacterium]
MHALILIDIQKDFMPGGPLPTKRGDEIVAGVNKLQERFPLVVATQDWHPPDHGSFASNHEGREPMDVVDLHGLEQILWPDHCVQDSDGARFVDGLSTARVEAIFRKGMDPEIDSYSGFFDNGHRKKTGLGDYLRGRGVEDVWICGVATDVCVKFTALDARELGFRTRVIEDATRGVEAQEGDIRKALDHLRERGCEIVRSPDVPHSLR